jgi:hypothetical protein
MDEKKPTHKAVLAALETLFQLEPKSDGQMILVGTQDEDGDLNLYSLSSNEWLPGMGDYHKVQSRSGVADWLIERFEDETND